MYKEKIGIIGGFGAYATLDFFKRILDMFASDCERNYPHVLLDNNFTMPSRTKALLTGEDYEIVVEEIAESLKKMCEYDVEHIILPCGTAHAFLNDVYKIIPEARGKIINLIETSGKTLAKSRVDDILVIAAEGSMKNRIYSEVFRTYGISCCYPEEEEYATVRYFIECVKRNELKAEVEAAFFKFLEKYNKTNILLGCTELPVLTNYIFSLQSCQKDIWNKYVFWNPLEMVLIELKNRIK